jgi:transcriptional regulator with PAS, ATPase and Fis domain
MILGRSAAILEIRQTVLRFAELDAPVLIIGETGTGKELVAQALHDASRRRRHPFTAFNCGAITETLLESELFGHERGAFTGAEKSTKGLFEATGSGTILLDEIGDISPRLQAALLRVLETSEIRAVGSSRSRKINCRIVAATNADLIDLASRNLFRKDLLFRLQRLGIHLPPLRERPEDIMPLVRHFLDTGRRIGVHARVSKDLRETLLGYEWPGNVRELRNVIERMRLMHSDKLSYSLADLDLKFHAVNAPRRATAPTLVSDAEAEGKKTTASDELPAGSPSLPRRKARPAATPSVTVGDVLRSGTSSVRRLDRLRELFAEHEKLTRSEVIEILGVSPNTATKYLKALIYDGLIERVEPSASTRSHYFVLKASREK